MRTIEARPYRQRLGSACAARRDDRCRPITGRRVVLRVGRVYQQTFNAPYSKVVFAKLHDRKTPLPTADLLNDRALPLFYRHDIPLLRVLTDRGTEYCGNPEHDEYELYLAVENIDHTRTKTKSLQTNGFVERLPKTVFNELYRVSLRKKVYASLDALQADLDAWLDQYKQRARTSGTIGATEKRLCTPSWRRPYSPRRNSSHIDRACHRSPQSHVRSSRG